jgi:hypothetical protein
VEEFLDIFFKKFADSASSFIHSNMGQLSKMSSYKPLTQMSILLCAASLKIILIFCKMKFSHFSGIMPKPQFTLL